MPEPRDEALDPNTSPERLFALAGSNPELAPIIAAHPNAYPQLRAWASTIQVPSSATSFGTEPWITQPTAGETPKQRAWWSRRSVLIGGGIGVVVLLVVAGGAWFISSRLGGAATPTAAAEKLLSSAEALDPIGLYGSLAPSEVGELQTAFQKLADAHPKNGVDAGKVLSELREALHISSEDMRFRSTKIADGVERVTWTTGTITVSGSERKLADALFSAYEPEMRASLKQAGQSSGSIEEAVAASRRSMEDSIRLPQTLDAKDTRTEITVIAVQEGSGWYISPMMTAADYWEQSVTQNRGEVQLGDSVIEANHFDTPEAAAGDLAKAVVRQDTGEMAADFPLPERRVLSIYGPVWERLYPSSSSNATKLSLTDSRFHSKIDGDRAALTMNDVTVTSSRWDSDVSQDLTSTYTLSDTCLEYKGEYAYDNGSVDDYTGMYQSDYQVDQTSGRGCLSDIAVLRKLGIDDMSIQAVRENGGWLVSPVATLGDALSIATTDFLKYEEQDRLADLFR